MKRFLWALSLVLVVSVAAFSASGQFSLSGGYSTKMAAIDNDLWSGGFNVSGHGLIQVAPGFYVGLEGAYHRWGFRTDWFQDVVDLYAFYGIDVDFSASASMIQIFPCLRFEFVHAGAFKPFIHVGGGLSVVSAKAEYSASYLSQNYSEKLEESNTRFGGNAGIGARLLVSNSMGIEAIALYNLHSNKGGGTTNWISFGVGLSFGR